MKKKFLTNIKALSLVIVAALTLEVTALVQYYYSQKGIREEASMRAESQLESTRNKIMDVINQAEAAVRNSVWVAQWCLNYPDSLQRVCQRMVEDNPVVAGSTVALVPGYLKDHPLFAPYVYRDATGSLQLLSLATPEYDYPAQEWFTKPVELGEGCWSEPYVDEGGGEMLMTTFSMPIRDRDGVTAAVLTADLSLDWLTELVGNVRVYPEAFSMMLSRTGRIMVCPVETLVMRKTASEVIAGMDDGEALADLTGALLSGTSGSMSMDYKGATSYVYFAPVERTGWSMSIVIPENEIYGGLKRMGTMVLLLQLIGLAMIVLMLRSFIKGQLRYRALEQRRERIEGELHIANSIQMSMVPLVFPPFPERHDLDMAATIVPAKEVGGDLYDFFIRGEKLFFCVGDVSGKGVPASLVMAVTRTSFRNMSAHEDSPGRIVTAMNNSLSAMNESSMFVTFFCGVLDLTNGQFRYCNAGHNPPMILTDAISPLPVVPNLPLGIMQGMAYEEQQTVVRYDDALFLYTDGLTEAENAQHEQFGEARMEAALHGRKSAHDHLENIKQQVADFVGDAPQSDDLTILFIHYLPAARRLTLRNDISEIPRLSAFVEATAQAFKLDETLVPGLNLALEEAVANVMQYAYPKGTAGTVDIAAGVSGDALTFTVTDAGQPFDPTTRAEVDINAGVEERPIGGLGIHLVRQIMDSVSYERVGEKNVLTLGKRLRREVFVKH